MSTNLENSAMATGLEKWVFIQSQRKAMPKNAQTTAQLHSSHMLVKECSKFSKPGSSNTPVPYNEKDIFLGVSSKRSCSWNHSTSGLQCYWLGNRLGLPRYGMVCLGNEQRSFCHFWDCIQVLHFGLFCWPWWTSRCSSWFEKRQRNQRSNCQHPLDHQKSKRVPEKHPLLLYWLCQSLWLDRKSVV